MRFEDKPVPAADWVEILSVTNKDGSELAPDNWRRTLAGTVTLCWIAGGFQRRGAFYKSEIRIKDGEVISVDLHTEGCTSTTSANPNEVEPGIYELETNTALYYFRLLTDQEEKVVMQAVHAEAARERDAMRLAYAGNDNTIPAS